VSRASEGAGEPNLGESSDESPDLRSVNARTARALSEMLRSTLGPWGRDKMLVDSDGMVVVTNDGATIIGELDVETEILPVGRMLHRLAASQDDQVGDGTTTAVVLAAELVIRAEELVQRGLAPTTVADGYRRAAELASTKLDRLATSVDPDDDAALEEVVRVALTGRGTESTADALPQVLVPAVRSVETPSGIDLDRIRVVTVPGGTVANSYLLDGLVLDNNEPVDSAMPERVDDAGIACVTGPIGTSTGSDETSVTVGTADEISSLATREAAAFRDNLRAVDAGVSAVFCSDEIDDTAARLLADEGVLATQLTTPDDVRDVARATGARVVGGLRDLDAADLGHASRVEMRYVGFDRRLLIGGCADPTAVSLVLHGETEHVVDETERAARDGLGVVRTMLLDGRVVPGAGAVEVALASELRDASTGIETRAQFAVEAFADALETVPVSLARNAGLDPIDTLTELRARHHGGARRAGVHPDEGVVDDVFDHGIREPHRSKRLALAGAVDVAVAIVRIDDLLSATDLTADA
jgi:chaperonin GroEL (HSP60 family)